MNKFKLFTTASVLLACTYGQIEAQLVNPPVHEESHSIPADQLETLDLTYVYGGDYTLGRSYSEDELIQKIMGSPNLVELNLSGQSLSPGLMSLIHDHLPKLKKLILKGSVRFVNGDGMYYSSEAINQQEISPEMLQALFLNGSPIEILDLSLSNINDAGLEMISQGGYGLKELYLQGASDLTDTGIKSLVGKLPNLKLIDLSKFTIRQPMDNRETIEPKVSSEVIKNISEKGIIVLQNERTPWF
jgi:hypothetical protein